MEVKAGQIWRIVGLSEKSVVEVTSITGNAVFFEYDGEETRIKDWLTVSEFLEFHEFVRNKGDAQMIKPKYPSSIRTKGIAVKTDDKGVVTGIVHHKENAPKPDMVNKPPHYKDASGIECKEITCHREMPFSLGNAIKYLYRAGSKGDLLEDLKKAEWYLRVAYLNSEAVPVEVVRRLSEVAAVRKTQAGRALNLISRRQALYAYRVVKTEIERMEAGSE